jgi:hypothetical protein
LVGNPKDRSKEVQISKETRWQRKKAAEIVEEEIVEEARRS